MNESLGTRGAWALVGVLFALVAITLPELGSDPWPFRPGEVDAEGPLGPLVRAAGEEYDLGIPRAAAFLAGLLCGAGAVWLLTGRRDVPRWAAVALVLAVGVLLTAPATLLQLGLRDSTAPWFFTNDSTYQVELGGELLIELDNPYGHDYRESGLERFYTRDGTVSERVREREVALEHFAYFPGAVASAAVWRLLPEPFDDYRLLVLLCNLGMLAAALAFRGPLAARLVLGAVLVCSPIAVRSAWFGQNDAPSLLLLVVAFALASRRRFGWAAAALAGAVLLKQFALVAVPFLALMILRERGSLRRPALAFGGVLAAGILPFLVADPVAFYEDTIRYGAGTYRIVGYGLSAILIELGVLNDREGAYPFALLALLTWLPLSIWLLLVQRRSEELWVGAAAFAVSILWLMFIGRTFNNYYLVWPMTGAVVAALLACARVRPIDLSPGEAVLHEGDPARCAVVLPGVRYFSQAPLLWFAREAAQARGWSVLELSERAPGDEEPFAWMRDRAERALNAAEAGTVAVIGKSLASAAAPLVAERGLPAVWLTPLLIRPEIVEALAGASAPALLVGSSADPSWSGGELPSGDLLEVAELDRLDHSLQVEGDPSGSLDALRDVTERVGAFLERVA